MTKARFDEITDKDPALLDFTTELVADRLDSRRPTAYRTIGKYVTTDIIGRGAFSIVYKGEHTGLGMPVAIKMMRHDMAMNTDFLSSFRNEARTIANLDHEHIVKVYDFDGRYRTLFIIMEHVRGNSLKDMISHLRALPPKLAISFLVQICSALDYAHHRGIIHRDINPSNVIVQPNDQLKVLDFGLSCPTGTEDCSNTGTAHYMAPEQIEGLPVDPRSDIYALGAMAYEMVTGRRPFAEYDLKSLFDLHMSHDIPDPAQIVPNLPDELREFILNAGRCDPDERYRDMDQAMAALSPPVNGSVLKSNLPIWKRKMSTVFLMYTEENELALNRLMKQFSVRAQALGVEVKLAGFQTPQRPYPRSLDEP
jgi:serine/threonine protein kinase